MPYTLEPKFQEALAVHREGRLTEAAQLYEALIAAEPARVDALVHLGGLRLAQQRSDEAEALLRQALKTAPHSPEAHANLAAVLLATHRAEEAITHYEHAMTLECDLDNTRYGLASALQRAGRREAAVAKYREVLSLDPKHAEAQYGLGTLLIEMGNDDAAIAAFRLALSADADFAEASYALGTLLERGGQTEEAIACYRQALDVDAGYTEAVSALSRAFDRLDRHAEAVAALRILLDREPDSFPIITSLARALVRQQNLTEAGELWLKALAVEPENAAAMAEAAYCFGLLDRHEEAISLCRRALALNPDSAIAHSVLGVTLAQLGRMGEALLACERALALAPATPIFAYNLIEFSKVTPVHAGLTALEALLPNAAHLPPREQCWLYFGLAKAYDDLGKHDRSFALQLEGNAMKRRMINYDEDAAIRGIERIAQAFTLGLLAARGGGGDPSARPIFIVGMPRSGTTLVEQILASHPMVHGAGERRQLPDLMRRVIQAKGGQDLAHALWNLPKDELRQLGAAYDTSIAALAPSAERVTDKMPANFHFVGMIRLILPNARIIHMVRDRVDTCLSCFSKLFVYEQLFTYDLAELGRYYRAYQRLMAHWQSVLPEGAMLEVRYEAVVDDLEGEARRILAYCGLPWSDACLEFHKTSRPVATASLAQVRNPIYRNSVGRWRPDSALLRPLTDALETRR